jgi:hypothetical protein
MIACTISNLIGFCALALTTLLILPTRAQAQWSGRDGWVEEPATKSLNVEGDLGHSYLDPSSVHRGDDGLVYFNESSGVTQPEEIGRTGFMKDAYDCAKNIKYMCVGLGDWRNDQKSAIHAANDPALQIYRKYLCGDAAPAANASRADPTTKPGEISPHP